MQSLKQAGAHTTNAILSLQVRTYDCRIAWPSLQQLNHGCRFVIRGQEFIRVDRPLVFELVTAANYMKIQPLLDLTCLAVAVGIKNTSPREMRAIFNIRNEFSPEEE